MIPYLPHPSFQLGPLEVHMFGIMVATAIIVGIELAMRRSRKIGLDPNVTYSVALWAVVIGWVISHWFAVFAYYPERLLDDPWLFFRVWDGISSFGGMAGGLFGIWLYFRMRQPQMPAREKLAYLDNIAFVWPFAWIFGRLGCTFAHDHPGKITEFPLAIRLDHPTAWSNIQHYYAQAGQSHLLPPVEELRQMAFHQLGWYEFLYTLLVIVPIFLWLKRKPRQPGFYLAAFMLTYTPIRFFLDFLRIGETQYLGLTPGQYMSLLLLGGTLLVISQRKRLGLDFAPLEPNKKT